MKVIRPTYPKEVSIGLLLLIFVVSFFLSSQIFAAKVHRAEPETLFGMFLVGSAVVIMVLVLWEEFLFPIRVKPIDGGLNFRNHRNKLRKQLLIYLAIPAIFIFIFMEYELNPIRYSIWASICIIAPLVGKIFSGLKNYNDFLNLTTEFVEYKNNEKTGKYQLSDIREISLVKDSRKVLHKFQLTLADQSKVMIDLDEMELEAFYDSIDKFIAANYQKLLKG